MLKQYQSKYVYAGDIPAAFRRLCVETMPVYHQTEQHLPAAFRRLCVETLLIFTPKRLKDPAAFRRLCVETNGERLTTPSPCQPPSGGCVLKRAISDRAGSRQNQPPSGGCVLKRWIADRFAMTAGPAAFRRLCVETAASLIRFRHSVPAAFRRLCVETAR